MRSEHAGRDGKVFDWNDPPEGGHPGEAPNCRCRAEEVEDNKAECERLKAQLEVDSANLESARDVYKNATHLLNQQGDKLTENSDQRDQLMEQAITEFGVIAIEVLTGRINPGSLYGLVILAAQYSELEIEYGKLSDRFYARREKWKFALQNLEAAKAIRAATQEKFDRLGCSHQ